MAKKKTQPEKTIDELMNEILEYQFIKKFFTDEYDALKPLFRVRLQNDKTVKFIIGETLYLQNGMVISYDQSNYVYDRKIIEKAISENKLSLSTVLDAVSAFDETKALKAFLPHKGAMLEGKPTTIITFKSSTATTNYFKLKLEDLKSIVATIKAIVKIK